MEYTGEHLLIGQLGKAAIILALCSAIIATIMFLSAKHRNKLLVAASGAFLLHTMAIASACVFLLVMIFGHTFEYQYVWQYTSRDLSATYLFSAFWAGKEGSMLLWLLFQAVLGMVLMFRRSTPPAVMGVIAAAQCLLGIMLIGCSIGDFQLGRSPFVLLREMPDYAAMPLFGTPDYLSFLKDGNGLNPLLHNPWMAIHPPVLFLGYAACLIPYAFSIVSSATKKERVMVPLFWPVFAAFCLGAGLVLGGAWAYQDLTFGGFWSWDPVENASLVPWLLMLASLHLLLNPKFRTSGITFSITPYVSVLFAAYLTRSGVLSNTSVHSFSGGQGSSLLLAFTLLAILIPLVFQVFRKKIPASTPGENIFSPWIWMLIGSGLLILSAFQILFVTSVPAMNAWFGSHLAPPADNVAFYNNWQQGFVAGIALCMGITLYLPAKEKNLKAFMLRALPGTSLSLLLLFMLILVLPALSWNLYIVLFCLFFGGFAMLDGMLRVNRRKSNFAASVTHTGFAIFIIGVILTFSLQKNLGITSPNNPKGLQTLVLGQIKPLQKGYVSYAGRTVNGNEIKYRLDFLYKAGNGQYYLNYTLYPSMIEKEGMAPIPKPDTRKTLTEDIFVYLNHAEITREEYEPLTLKAEAAGDSSLSVPVQKTDYVVMSARSFPGINILWMGIAIMAAGMILSLVKRRRNI